MPRGIYNDPSIGEAASNIASMFAPPSAQDIYAGAKAAETRQKTQALAEYFAHANDPSITRDQRENAAIALGLYNPTQSYYSVDQGNETSRANNAADNTRALKQTDMQQTGETTRTLLAPVGEGATRFVPPDIASQFKLPDKQIGSVSAQPGEEITLADGRVVKGAPKPLSETEVKGGIIQSLSPEEQRAIGLSDIPVETAIDPATGAPQIMRRSDAVGKAPEPKSGLTITTNPDGTTTVTQGGSGAKTTEAENKTAYASVMAEEATNKVLQQFDAGALPSTADYQILQLMQRAPPELYPTLVQNMSPAGQTFYQGVRTSLPLQLMVQSGLATTEGEAARKQLELVPVPGEDAGVTAMKRRQFETFIQATKGLSGGALNKANAFRPGAPGAPPAPGQPPAPPVGLGAVPESQGGGAPPIAPGAEHWERVNGKLVRVK